MKLNIKTKILLNGILLVIISILLVTIIFSFLLWEKSEQNARLHIRRAIKVIALQIREMESDLKEIAIKIGIHQDYASKANFIQENKENKVLWDMLEGEKKELASMLYEVAITSNIPLLILYDENGDWMCAILIEKDHTYLNVNISTNGNQQIRQAILSLGKHPQRDDWKAILPSQYQKQNITLHKYPLPLPLTTEAKMNNSKGKVSLEVTSPLQVRMLNTDTLKEEYVQKGLIQVFQYLDDSFIQSISNLTDTQINLFVGAILSVGNLNAYKMLDSEYFSKLKKVAIHGISVVENILYKEIRINNETFFEGLVPVSSTDHSISIFSVLLSQEGTRKAQWEMIRSLVFVALICILIGMPLTWFFTIKEIIIRERLEKELAIYREHLEERVAERTRELAKANTELDQKNIRLNETLEKVEAANQEITASIQYAKTIQRSLLPDPDMVKTYLPNSFVIWIPCEIVSGDIFYIDIFEQGFIIGVMDCTGHGVPGAFMTMLASSKLRRIIKTEQCHDPAEILKRLNHSVKTTLQQDTEYALSDDGMDAAICLVKPDENALIFAGAKLPLIYVCNNECVVIKGDKHSLGYKHSDVDFDFTNHTLQISKGISFYLASDGFTDQLGGKKGLHFGGKRFKNLLMENRYLPFAEQQDILTQAFYEYKGENEMQDDVTVVGFAL